MELNENIHNTHVVRALGLKESISMTIGTVVGVGLFTTGSAQIGKVGPWIIAFTFGALLISIWPCLLYGEMSAMIPVAGGTYNYAKYGLNRIWANIAGWQYIVSVVAIGSGETLSFANYFKILLEQFGLKWATQIDSRIIAVALIIAFLILNYHGIEMSGKAQTAFVFFFWGCSILWFLYMIPRIHLNYFGGFAMNSFPPFKELMYIFGLVWWCYTGFETCVSMGSETKYPQYTLPRALKISIFLVFAVNALFQWFLVGLVPHHFYNFLATATAPYADALKITGMVGFPIILLCIGIAFGGDLSTINPGIAAPARYIYAMADDNALPKIMSKIHPKYKTPYVAVIVVGIINIILILTGSINYIASVSLVSLAICYIIGCLAFAGLRMKYPKMKRPYKAPYGMLGVFLTIGVYLFMLLFADQIALMTAVIIVFLSIIYVLFTKENTKKVGANEIAEQVGIIEEPSKYEKKKIDHEYAIWKYTTLVVSIFALAIYLLPIIINR
ncbi:amino acid:polyamine antiporter [Lactobacillus johnsonii]|uniref:APC family permease n=1 Tax=Lactobacillus johnsonii TaxID=33959 RepID=UPI000BA3EA3D|nr:APC family permease [Lactobacillus johnsonii]PAB54119.1 amino acid:polyamine antiporter [Lactobacillus johnsonii]PEG68978.1 APC family permease [Lactobacillus johnsonii]